MPRGSWSASKCGRPSRDLEHHHGAHAGQPDVVTQVAENSISRAACIHPHRQAHGRRCADQVHGAGRSDQDRGQVVRPRDCEGEPAIVARTARTAARNTGSAPYRLGGGDFDVILLVGAIENTDLRRMIFDQLHAMTGIVDTQTYLVFEDLDTR